MSARFVPYGERPHQCPRCRRYYYVVDTFIDRYLSAEEAMAVRLREEVGLQYCIECAGDPKR